MGALAAPARRSGAPGSELRDPYEVSAAARREGGMEHLYYPFNRPVPQGRSSAISQAECHSKEEKGSKTQ